MRLAFHVRQFITKLIRYDSKRVKLFVVTLLLCSVTFYSWLFYILFRERIKDHRFMGLEKCPACYGMSLCTQILLGNLKLHGWSRVGPLDFVNVKNVHTGTLNGVNVILKKLGQDGELRSLDEEICREAGTTKDCKVNAAVQKHPLVTAHELNPSSMEGLSDLVACPSQRLVDLITGRFREDPVGRRRRGGAARMYLATTLMINPEPLIMQIFPAEEGWPFPRYEGACGRFVAAEDVGPTLLDHYNRPWQERVDYAYQVMKIAELFTENESGFALYLTDLNYDNLAVNMQGKVIIIDLENIIVVDRSKIKKEKRMGWDVPYFSTHDLCQHDDSSCVSFSVDKLCVRYITDFNYYTACRNLLSADADDAKWRGGLLHDLPEAIEARLRPLVDECSRPKGANGRLKVKERLIAELHTIRNEAR